MWTCRRSGNTVTSKIGDHRSPYERDQTRVVHSFSFRRLQRKTQILGTSKGDFHRTRLTHSLETASIGRSLIRNFMHHYPSMLEDCQPSEDLIGVICLLHDIGHPPFGHGGETALNFMMHDAGGFESNAQTLRLITKIETSYGDFGLDLTRRTLLGILKYPICYETLCTPSNSRSTSKMHRINDWVPPKGYYATERKEIDWILEPFSAADRAYFQTLITTKTGKQTARFYSFDCSVMDLADNIAYGVHDLEDAIYLHLIERDMLETDTLKTLLNHALGKNEKERFLSHLFSKETKYRKEAVSELVHYFITQARLSITDDYFEHPLLKYNLTLSENAARLLTYLIDTIYHHVINCQTARTFEFGGQSIILKLFEAILSNPQQLLNEDNRLRYQKAETAYEVKRIISDYIANMSDEYAGKFHEKLFGFERHFF